MKLTPTDDKLEQEGAWVDYYDYQLQIARYDVEKHQKLFQQLTRPHRKQIENDTISDELVADITVTIMVRQLLLNWSDNVPMEYNEENAKKLLLMDRDCRDFVNKTAKDINNYMLPKEEEIELISEK